MYATISADIVSSTSLSEVETIELKQYIEEQLKMLETLYPGSWDPCLRSGYGNPSVSYCASLPSLPFLWPISVFPISLSFPSHSPELS